MPTAFTETPRASRLSLSFPFATRAAHLLRMTVEALAEAKQLRREAQKRYRHLKMRSARCTDGLLKAPEVSGLASQ